MANLNVGDTAPDFDLPDPDGNRVRLGELLAAGPVVVFFYPAAMTSGCTAESCHFRDLAAEFAELGARRVGISTDPVEKQREFTKVNNLDYPVLSDPEATVTSAFGVSRGKLLSSLSPTKRQTFVIDTDGTVLEIVKSEVRMQEHADGALRALRARAES